MVGEPFARPAPHIAALFPPGVVAFEAVESQGRAPSDTLFDVERVSIQHAVGSRVDEFAAGRACARAALMQLGLPPTPIPAGTDRAPIWPQGYTGSISHTKAYCVAVAAPLNQGSAGRGVVSLGVDVELRAHVPEALWPQLMRSEEVQWLQTLQAQERADFASVIFSAKEAFYKAQYGLTQGWVDFDDVAITLLDGSFSVQVRKASLPIAQTALGFSGRYLIRPDFVLTALAI